MSTATTAGFPPARFDGARFASGLTLAKTPDGFLIRISRTVSN